MKVAVGFPIGFEADHGIIRVAQRVRQSPIYGVASCPLGQLSSELPRKVAHTWHYSEQKANIILDAEAAIAAQSSRTLLLANIYDEVESRMLGAAAVCQILDTLDSTPAPGKARGISG
jgi:hypothetical protein